MILLDLENVVLGDNRQRREFEPEPLAELASSIERTGFMHPIVIRFEGKQTVLVAGERRLKAIRNLNGMGKKFRYNNTDVPAGKIPAVSLGELDELEAWEAELEENIVRTDLTWQERAAAVRKLHELRTLQAEKRGEVHTVTDTAEEVTGRRDGDYQTSTKKAIVVAKHLEDPDVQRSRTLDDAFKVLKRKEQAQKHADLAAQVGATYSVEKHEAYCGDCREILVQFPDATFDVIVSDPPYGMGADEFGDSGGARSLGAHEYDDSPEHFFSLMDETLVQLTRVARPQAHIYLFCDIDKFAWLRQRLSGLLWSPLRTPLVMVKRNSGRVPFPEHGPRRQYELVLYAWRGGKPVTAIYPDVFEVGMDENLGHGAQKPIAAYTELLKRSVRPGDKVLDPMMGSGPIFPAATALQCYATGIEVNQSAYGVALSRIREAA